MSGEYLWQTLPLTALISAVVTLAIRYVDRPRPAITLETVPFMLPEEHFDKFTLFVQQRDLDSNRVVLRLNMLLINHGDGDAYDVRVYGSYCDVAIDPSSLDRELLPIDHWTHRIPVLKSGSAVKLVASLACYGEIRHKDWERDHMAIIVAWTTGPGRRWHRKIRRRVKDIEVAPPYKPGDLERPQRVGEKIGTIPFYVRRLHSMEKRGLRSARKSKLRYWY